MPTISLIFFLISYTVQSSAAFGYSKRQQHTWPREFKLCAGKMQSPIALSTQKSVILPLPALEMNGFHDFLSGPITLVNNGNSVALINGKSSGRRLPYVFGAMLSQNQQYEYEGLHFHWGFRNNRGSEHVLNGIRYPMEMHIIHRNIAYSSMQQALDHADGLTVLGVFFQLQDEDNDELNVILKNLQQIQWTNSKIKLNISITLNSLLPQSTETFYSYRGSLTTPPCSEAVTWIIFSQPVAISYRQMNKFRSLSNGEDVLADNYRKLQYLGKRKIYMRKLTLAFASDTTLVNLNVTDLDWFWR